jgi:hypothetical protein
MPFPSSQTSRWLLPLAPLVLTLLPGCETTQMRESRQARVAMDAAIPTEAPGNYYIGRRLFKKDYKFWGFVRKPCQPWATAKLVMLNEQTKLAPDREANDIGSDNEYEYKLIGEFSGETVYEPASNGFYPEFKLRGTELRSSTPASIYKVPGATDPSRRIIPPTY